MQYEIIDVVAHTCLLDQVIQEAQEIAVRDHHVEFKTNLWVAESFASKGDVIKGVRRHARGRMGEVS